MLDDYAPPAHDPRQRIAVDVALIGLAVAAVALVATAPGGPARPIVVFFAMVLLPGASILTVLPVRDRPSALALAVVLSLAIDTLVSVVLVWSTWFEPIIAGAVVLASCVLLLLLDLRRQGALRRSTAA